MKNTNAFAFLLLAIWLCSSTLLALPIDKEITETVVVFDTNLSVKEKAKASLRFENPDRSNWTNLPVGLAKRPGIQIGELSSESKVRFHNVLTTIFSSQGYLKLTSIMKLDDVLNQVYAKAFKNNEIDQKTYHEIRDLDWDYENYFITLWGKPGTTAPWGLKFEGHHISINLTSNGSDLSITPLFFGSDPAEVTKTKYAGLRVLAKEEDYGLRLINSLSDPQKKIATLSREVPENIITNPEGPKRLERLEGIAVSELTPNQVVLLKRLISEYINNLEYNKRQEFWEQFKKSDMEKVKFAWIGSYERYKPHYYIIHGLNFIIEYDNISWDKKGADHIHTIWREKGNDFGEDILLDHYKTHDHEKGK